MKRILNKGLVVITICLLLLTSVPLVIGDDNQYLQSNTNGLADKVKIEVKKGGWLHTLLRFSVFRVILWNGNNRTINYFLNVNVTTRKGEVLFELKHDLIEDFTPGLLDNWGFWYYTHFRQKGFIFGCFDINVKIQVVEDASIKTHQGHGIIFWISALIWD